MSDVFISYSRRDIEFVRHLFGPGPGFGQISNPKSLARDEFEKGVALGWVFFGPVP